MSEKIQQYLKTSMLRPHCATSNAINKEILLWTKKSKLKKYENEIDSITKMIEGMIDKLLDK